MLRNLKSLYSYKLAALDGDIGHVEDFYFNDKSWTIHYLVASTGAWLTDRLVLISPQAFGRFDEIDGKALLINLTRKQIENSPPIESHKPVSRQYEIEYHRYYGWPVYWDAAAMGGLGGYPVVVPPAEKELASTQSHNKQGDPHLRSTRAVAGSQIQTVDGPVGQLTSFIVDDRGWAIRKLVVETGHWYSGKEIFISPSKVERISYEDSKVFVTLSKEEIQSAAENDRAEAGISP